MTDESGLEGKDADEKSPELEAFESALKTVLKASKADVERLDAEERAERQERPKTA